MQSSRVVKNIQNRHKRIKQKIPGCRYWVPHILRVSGLGSEIPGPTHDIVPWSRLPGPTYEMDPEFRVSVFGYA